MIKTLIISFAVYSLSSGNRLLLQNQAQYVPIPPETPAQPLVPLPEPAVPLPVPPTVPEPPAFPAVPQTPSNPPQTPANLPPVPAVPTVPTLYPQGPQYQAAPAKLECKASPPSPLSCAAKIQTITNPSHNFELLCAGYEACAGSTVNINFLPNADPHMESFKGLWFVEEYAAAGAVINFYNQRPGDKIIIDEITCDKPRSCFYTQIIIGTNMELQVGDFFCAPGACDGCVVKESATGPGIPCFEYTEPI